MIKRVLLVMAAALVFSAATPSYATFWNSHNSHRGNRWSNQNNYQHSYNNSYNWDWDWLDCDEPQQDNDCDWDWNWDCDWDWDWLDCGDKEPPVCDNPVPEPATAGLAFMGLGALTAAVRRRRK